MMRKRLMSLLLVFCMVFSLLPTSALAAETTQQTTTEASENPFKDVKASDWCYDAVQYARANGFFNGTTATTFTPDGSMTRGMFVTVLGRMAGVDPAAYQGDSSFKDVPANMYYAPYVAWAAKYGITGGTGNGNFSPNARITRQQMAAFFVRYFEAFDVNYETDANVTTTPADLDSVSDYAKDAVLKLWKQGLLNGDGKRFNPNGNATRAQAATLCMRTDKAVETWYQEPGVPSERVSVDPAVPQKPEETKKPTSSGRDDDDDDDITYYQVTFAMGAGQSVDMTLPATATYPSGTPISSLPTPAKAGTIFLGWYYNADMTDGVEAGDTVKRNMTLYAKVAAGEAVTPLETPNYVTRTEVAAGTYTFDVVGAANIGSAVKFINVTGGNLDVDYTVSGNTVTATLEAGQTYQVELTDDAARFRLSGESDAQPESIRYLNILTAKEETKNASLNSGVKQIDVGTTAGLPAEVFNGLYQIDTQGRSTENTTSGTFTYSGTETLEVGDTLAITSGSVDLTDVTSTTGDVAYVKITDVSGTTYSYEMANVEDVLYIPDVVPIAGTRDGSSVIVSVTEMAAAMLAAEADALDVDDFIGFYTDTDAPGYTGESIDTYGKITDVAISGDSYVITYTAADVSAVEDALDVYYTQDQAIELTEDEKNQIESDIKNDVEASGYVEEAALYLASMMLESNNLEELPDMERVAENMRTMRASSVQYGNGTVTRTRGSNSVSVDFDKRDIKVSVKPNAKLEHLNGKGFDVSVEIPFTVTIGSGDNQLEIEVTAEFEEEVLLKQKISTKRHKIGFLKYDYSLNASFEVGNYTGIGFKADITTGEGDESMIDKLNEIMERMEEYQNGDTDSADDTMDSLAEIYQDVMDNANDAWIELLNVKLFETDGNAFLHIFCWQVKGSFVVSANLCVSMGMSYDYTMQKQYNFSVRVKAKTASNETIDIIAPQYNFNFYVVGTIGIRAGLRLEMYVGLISLKVDKIGITAEVGAYARLWGYFFYHLSWIQGGGKQTNSAGAMLIEIGIYLEIKFVAQALNSSKLTWNPTLYAHEWPLWSVGERQNVYAFNNTNDTNYTLITTRTLALPGSTYDMKYMDLKEGKTGTVSKDDRWENSFIITFSNPAFSYNAANNTVTVTPTGGSLAEETDMAITWKKAALSFTSKPIQKVIHLSWSDPEGLRYISFDSMGGSAVAQISGGSGAAITWPENPTKQGYTFAGWYTDSDCMTAYAGSTTEMPTFSKGTKGMTLYAKWTPATVSYTVEHYQQELNGTYTLTDTEQKNGITGEQTAAAASFNGVYVGFIGQAITQQTIAADGSTVVKVYYDRNTYAVTFKDGISDANDITQTYRYGAQLAAPKPAREGYTFDGWFTASEGGTRVTDGTEVTAAATYYAHWTGKNNTVIFDSQGGSTVASAEVRTGQTVTKPADPTREGYTFCGWYRDFTCTQAWDFAGDTVTGPMTFYAKWEVRTVNYTVKHLQQNLSDDGYTEVTADRQTLSGAIGAQTNATAKTYTGFTAQTVTQQTIAADGSTVVEVKYDRNTYTVKWMNGEDVLKTDENVRYGATPAYHGETPAKIREGYTCSFTGWTPTISDVTENVTYTAQFTETANTYQITYHGVDGAANSNPDTYTYGEGLTLNVPSKTGYAFAGWYADVEFSGDAVTAISTTDIGDKTFYAKWEAGQVTVTLDPNGGSCDSPSKAVTYNQPYGSLPTPEKTGHTFAGWYTAAENGTEVTENTTVTNADAHSLYAHWTANKYTVTLETNGGTCSALNEYTYGVVTQLPTPTRDGYDFAGWYADAEFSGDAVKVISATDIGDKTFYAKWEPIRPGDLNSISFGYAYDVQRDPAFPGSDSMEITLSDLNKPLMGDSSSDRKDTNAGTWTLSKLGPYSGVEVTSKYLGPIVENVAENYKMTEPEMNAIVIYELTDGDTHVAYGVILAYNSEDGYAVFLGDRWNGSGAGYLLSNSEKSGSFTFTAEAIITDFSQAAT